MSDIEDAEESLEEAEQRAETLMEAATIIEDLLDVSEKMVASGKMPEDDASAELQAKMEVSAETCRRVALSTVIALDQEDYWEDGDDDPPIGLM